MTRNVGVTAALLLAALALAAQSVKVVSPNGDESWPLNSSHDITWTSQGSGAVKVDIILRRGGARIGYVKRSVDLAAGRWPWTRVGRLEDGSAVPAATDYQIRIRDAGGAFYDDSDKAFAIAAAVPVEMRPLPDRLPPIGKILEFPRLEVSDIGLTPNAEGFGIIFSYKNVGKAPLPKASEVPVKPSYRVLIDGRETASGSLFIPAFATPPGWEQRGYFGGWIVLPNAEAATDSNWNIGNTITVHINENKAMGMAAHSLSLPLKPIALKHKFDLVRNGVSLDWSKRVLTVYLRLDGNVPPGRELFVYCGRYPSDDGYFLSKQPAKPGTYVVSKKVDFPSHYYKVTLYLHTYVTIPDLKQVWDMDYRNHSMVKLEFARPDPNPIM
jgi:hypothetical protein